jgi:hypothetical protein
MDAKDGGHSYARHGAHTTLGQQEYRAKTGVPPDIPNKLPCKSGPASTRFTSNVDHLDAIQKGVRQMDQEGTNRTTINMRRTIGEGYESGGGAVQNTSQVTIVRRNEKVVTAYPQL